MLKITVKVQTLRVSRFNVFQLYGTVFVMTEMRQLRKCALAAQTKYKKKSKKEKMNKKHCAYACLEKGLYYPRISET